MMMLVFVMMHAGVRDDAGVRYDAGVRVCVRNKHNTYITLNEPSVGLIY